MNAWFVSDIHLKHLNERNGNILLRFLLSLLNKERPCTHLFLLGDIFDLWFGNHEFYASKFQPIVDALKQLSSEGINVIYFEGNHDVHVIEFWKSLGIESYVDPQVFNIGKFKIRCEHGDFLNPNDLAYIKYRSYLRHPISEKAAQIIPAKFMSIIGENFSRISRKHSSKKRADRSEEIRKMIRDYAVKVRSDQEFDFIITGHMHVKDEFTFEKENKKVSSINLGSWFESQDALLINEQGASWVRLSDN